MDFGFRVWELGFLVVGLEVFSASGFDGVVCSQKVSMQEVMFQR